MFGPLWETRTTARELPFFTKAASSQLTVEPLLMIKHVIFV